MLRQTPSLEATEAFLVAARAPSFSAAASELALSRSAFSRRIQLLESFVGVSLFDRSGPRPQLTQAGERYLEDIAPALDAIRRATRNLRQADGVVRLTTSHSFAVGWLMPRLGVLRERGVEVELTIHQGLDILRAGRADLSICGGPEAPRDLISEVLIELEAFVVCAPPPAGGVSPCTVEELADCALLSTTTGPNLWPRWFEQVGSPLRSPPRGPTFPTLHSMYEAAASGLGVALAVPLASDRHLADKRLSRCLDLRAPVGQQYRLVYADRRQQSRSAVRILAEWLKTETAVTRDAFDTTSPVFA